MTDHQWESSGTVFALNYIGGLTPKDLRRERHCKVCGQGDVVPVEEGYSGGFVVGVYSRWDGVSTCEDVILERHRDATRAKIEREAYLRKIEEERPRRQAFIDDLNAICAKHGARIGQGDYTDAHIVVLEPRAYTLDEDGVGVQ